MKVITFVFNGGSFFSFCVHFPYKGDCDPMLKGLFTHSLARVPGEVSSLRPRLLLPRCFHGFCSCSALTNYSFLLHTASYLLTLDS